MKRYGVIGLPGPEVFGTPLRPSIRWSCVRCGKRCARSFLPSLDGRVQVSCKFCRAPAVFTITSKAAS